MAVTRGGLLPTRYYINGSRVNRRRWDEVNALGKHVDFSSVPKSSVIGDEVIIRETTRYNVIVN